jgi:hypothetical protein
MTTIESLGFGAQRARDAHIRLLALLLLTRRQAPFPKTMLKLDASRMVRERAFARLLER